MAIDISVARPAIQVGVAASGKTARQNWLRIHNGICISWFKYTNAGWSNVAKSSQKKMEADYQAFLKKKGKP